MADEYVLKIVVEGASSGSDQLAQQQGEIIPQDEEQVVRQPRQQEKPRTEQQLREERFNTAKKAFGVATAVSYVALDLYQQDRAFAGDTNRNLRINETKKQLGELAVAGGLLATGNFLGAGLYVAYTALNYAKENRELINTAQVDSYKTSYYQQRLVNDTTKRSR